jgi:tetratricopeptide (TPR) repeat protein
MSDNSYDLSTENIAPDSVGFEISNTGALLKRKDFLETDAAAQSQSHRHYYYKKDADITNVVNSCTQLLNAKPISVTVNGSMAASSLSSHEMDSVTRARILFVRGVSYVRHQQFTSGIEDLTEVINSKVEFVGESLPLENMVEEASMVSALYNRGVAYSKLDALNDAIRDFTSVLELDQDHVQAAYSRAACYNAQGQLVKAIEDYNLALMKDDNGKAKGGAENFDLKSPVQQRRRGR